MIKRIHSKVFRLNSLLLSLFLTACGGGGSDSSSNDAPTANAGPDVSARFGSEIVLSARDSYDTDGPIMSFVWQQVSGPEVTLAAVNSSSVKFTVPNEADTTELVFELEVQDNRGKTDTDQVTVTAVGPVDSDRFLTYLNVPADYVVEVALDDGVAALAADVTFDLVMTATQSYQDYNGDTATRVVATSTQSGTWTAQQQTDGSYPQFNFDIPSARIEDLVDVNKSARNDIDLTVSLQLENVTASVDYIIQVLDVTGNVINNTDIEAPVAMSLNGPTADGLEIDVNLMLDFLGNEFVESKNTAAAYYAAIDPDNEKTTLADWLAANNYDEANVTRAQYLNGFDLAFGRDMKVWTNDQNHVFSVVENYPNIDSLIAGSNHVATVAMEYSPGPNGGEPYTKYYTFVRDPQTGVQKRVGSMDFDGRGEKFTPGNCTICHGGAPQALEAGVYPNDGDIGGGFLLWDVDTFAFSDAEYEGRTPYEDDNVLSKSDQQAAFKTFNQTLLLTNITDTQRDLIYGWYGGDDMPSDTFDESYIPVDWRSPADGGPDTNPDTASDFYLEVFAPTCRACHNGIEDENLRFATYANFIAAEDDIIHRVFNEGSMPLARVTMDNFWVGAPNEYSGNANTRAELLAEHLSVDVDAQQPGLPIAVIDAQSVNDDATNTLPSSDEQSVSIVTRGDRINLSALNSLYGDAYSWALTLPDGSAATLSADDQATSSFVTDTYGDFSVALTIQNEFGAESVANYIYRIENNIPVAGDFAVSIKEDEVAQVNVFDSPTVLGDGEAADHSVVSVSEEQGGNAVIGVAGEISFTPSITGSASFDYQIDDIDGDESESVGTVSVTVTALPAASNDSRTVDVGTASDSRAISIAESTILSNDNLGVGPTSIVSVSRTGGSLTNGLSDCASEQGSMSYDSINDEFDYTPPVACVGSETYQYTIRDSNGDESSATITMTVQLSSDGEFSNVITAIALNAGNCASCHINTHVFDLSGDDVSKWAELVECNLTPADGDCAGNGARINLDTPANSIVLQKVLGGLSHGGGPIFPNTSDANYLRLLRWIEEGAAAP